MNRALRILSIIIMFIIANILGIYFFILNYDDSDMSILESTQGMQTGYLIATQTTEEDVNDAFTTREEKYRT